MNEESGFQECSEDFQISSHSDLTLELQHRLGEHTQLTTAILNLLNNCAYMLSG